MFGPKTDSILPSLEVEPWECTICERLTEGIRELSVQQNGYSTPQGPPIVFDSVEGALRQIAATLRLHGKWFAEAALADLLRVSKVMRKTLPMSETMLTLLPIAFRHVSMQSLHQTLPLSCLLLSTLSTLSQFTRSFRLNHSSR